MRSVIATFVIRLHAQRAHASVRNIASFTKTAIRTKRASRQRPHPLETIQQGRTKTVEVELLEQKYTYNMEMFEIVFPDATPTYNM